MYPKILVAMENSKADAMVLAHVGKLAQKLGSRLLLVHVADGWAARNYDRLKLAESEEMRNDRDYLEAEAEKLRSQGLEVQTMLALGNPPTELLKTAGSENCDLIAMGGHGHKWLADLMLGSTIDAVRHNTSIPLLVVRTMPPEA